MTRHHHHASNVSSHADWDSTWSNSHNAQHGSAFSYQRRPTTKASSSTVNSNGGYDSTYSAFNRSIDAHYVWNGETAARGSWFKVEAWQNHIQLVVENVSQVMLGRGTYYDKKLPSLQYTQGVLDTATYGSSNSPLTPELKGKWMEMEKWHRGKILRLCQMLKQKAKNKSDLKDAAWCLSEAVREAQYFWYNVGKFIDDNKIHRLGTYSLQYIGMLERFVDFEFAGSQLWPVSQATESIDR